MATMTTAEKNAQIKELGVKALGLPENAIQVGDYAYALPVEVEGETRYCKLVLTAKNNQATKTSPAYDPQDEIDEWNDIKNERARKAAEKAEAKAKKIAKSKK